MNIRKLRGMRQRMIDRCGQESPIINVRMMAIAAPIMEEILFRGTIIDDWIKDFPIIGVIVSFIILHLCSQQRI